MKRIVVLMMVLAVSVAANAAMGNIGTLGVVSVPEPMSLVLLGFGSLLFVRGRR